MAGCGVDEAGAGVVGDMIAGEERHREIVALAVQRMQADEAGRIDIGFARRHQTALAAMAERIGLDYFTIDCAENKQGDLLIFEADNTAVVHNMDSPEVFPYKPPQMRRIFEAFASMLHNRARQGRERAA